MQEVTELEELKMVMIVIWIVKILYRTIYFEIKIKLCFIYEFGYAWVPISKVSILESSRRLQPAPYSNQQDCYIDLYKLPGAQLEGPPYLTCRTNSKGIAFVLVYSYLENI